MGETASKYKICENITWRKVDNETVVLNMETSEYYSANSTGAEIWELLDKKYPLKKIVDFIIHEYDINSKTAENNVTGFLKKLSELKLIEKCR